MRLKTESETGERLLRHALPISFTDFEKKTDCFAVYHLAARVCRLYFSGREGDDDRKYVCVRKLSFYVQEHNL